MRKMMVLAVVGAMALFARAAESRSLKVLMIGNSFSEKMVTFMPPVARDLGLGLDVCSLYIGGCSLERHWQNVCAPTSTPYYVRRATADGAVHKPFNGNIPDVLTAEKWDVVTIQQASHFSWREETYHPWGEKLVAYIREKAPQAKIVVHETWSYTPWDRRLSKWQITPEQMYAKLHAAYASFARAHGLEVIPTGGAVQLVRQELPVKYAANSLGGDVVGSARFVQRDGCWEPEGDVFHMGPDGNHLQALVWAAKLYGVDVTTGGYAPAGMAPERAAFLRKIAKKAVESAGCP